jgi:hypothetical protein
MANYLILRARAALARREVLGWYDTSQFDVRLCKVPRTRRCHLGGSCECIRAVAYSNWH